MHQIYLTSERTNKIKHEAFSPQPFLPQILKDVETADHEKTLKQRKRISIIIKCQETRNTPLPQQ